MRPSVSITNFLGIKGFLSLDLRAFLRALAVGLVMLELMMSVEPTKEFKFRMLWESLLFRLGEDAC